MVESLTERIHELASRVERLMEDRASRAGADAPDHLGAPDHEAAETLEEWANARREAGAQAEAGEELSRLLHKGDTLAGLLERLTGPRDLCAAGASEGAHGAD